MAIQGLHEDSEGSFHQFDDLTFDPVQFLNDSLPSLGLSSQTTSTKQSRTSQLQSTSTEVQIFLTKLNTHSIRSSSELTSITDDILRSGNRLAYEVEVLRGNVNGLYDMLTDSLKEDISRFSLEMATQEQSELEESATENAQHQRFSTSAKDPDFIRQLRELGMVKSRLEAVINIFGEALKWPIPPSEVSMATNLISVSAPEFGVANTTEDDKAREYTRKLRFDITETLEMDGGGKHGLDVASRKISRLRAISQVWKGTAEEKARTRVVDNLAKLVEDKRKLVDSRSIPAQSQIDNAGSRSNAVPGRAGRIVEGSTQTAAGLFRNLQKLRDEIYQD